MPAVVAQLCIDSHDPERLARWWAQVLGGTVGQDEDEVWIDPVPGSGQPVLLFLRVPESKTTKNRLHLDLRPADGSDQAAELERLLRLGAAPADVGQGPDVTWHVLTDPEGNEFCLLRSTPAELAAEAAQPA